MDTKTCMLCGTIKAVEEIPKGWIIERKLDGYRTLWINGEFMNRRGNIVKYEHIKVDVPKDTILDGEIVVFDKEGKDDFNALQNIKNSGVKPYFIVFDVIRFNGEDLTGKPLCSRKEKLNQIGDKFVKTIDEIYTPSWNEVLDNGYEGLVIKNPFSPYLFKRSNYWLKLKGFKTEIGEIKGYNISDKRGFVIEYGDVRQRVAVQNPIIREQIVSMFGNRDLKAKIQYYEKTDAGMYRFPSFKELKRIVKEVRENG